MWQTRRDLARLAKKSPIMKANLNTTLSRLHSYSLWWVICLANRLLKCRSVSHWTSPSKYFKSCNRPALSILILAENRLISDLFRLATSQARILPIIQLRESRHLKTLWVSWKTKKARASPVCLLHRCPWILAIWQARARSSRWRSASTNSRRTQARLTSGWARLSKTSRHSKD